jgi:casein kinase 1
MNTPLNVLCADLPIEFEQFLQNCRTLRFTDAPDYEHLKHLLREAFTRSSFIQDFVYDWSTVRPVEETKSQPRQIVLPSQQLPRVLKPIVREVSKRERR